MYQLQFSQHIPAEIHDVWDFISSPHNLQHITPAYMGFRITNEPLPKKMYPGMIITYQVKPLLGIPLAWVTEITHVQDLHYFVDEQRLGPYAIWHHQHHLKPIQGGVHMTDIISYKPPFGLFGKIANSLFIEQQLKKIFNYRFQAIEDMFGRYQAR